MSIEVLKIPLAGAGQVEVRVGLNGNLALVKTAIDLGKGVILKQVKKSAEGIYKRGNWKTKIVTAPILLNMKKGEYKAFVDSIHDIGSWLNAVRKETDQNAENNALVSQEISVSEGYDLIRGATGGDEIAGIIGNLFGSAPKSLLEWDKKGFEKNQSYYAYKGKAEEIINIGKLISAVFKKGLYSGNSLGYKIYNYAQAKTCPVRAFISDKGHLLFRKANGKFKVFDWKGISSPKDRNFKTLFALNDFNYNENKKGNFVFKDEKQDLFMFDANGQAIKLYDHLRGKFVNTPASPVGKTESIPTPNIIRKKAYELDKSIDSMITKIKEQRLVEIDEISAVKDDIKNLKELVLPDINSQGEVSSITMDAALAEAASKGMTEEKLKTILSGHTKPTQKEQLYIDLIDNLDVNRMANFRKQLGLTEGEIYRFKQIIQGAEKALENYKPSLFDIAGPKVMADAVGFSGNLISGFAAASNSTVGGLSTQGIMAPLTAVWYIIGRTVPYLTATTAGLVTKYIFEKITGMDLASVIFHPVVTYRYMKNINRIKERWDWELEQADEDKNLVNWFGEDFLQEKLYSDEEEEAPKKKKRRISKKTKSRQAKKNKPEPEVNLADSVDIFKQEDDIPIEEPDPYFIEEPVFTKKKKAQPEVNLADGVDIFKQEDDIPMEEPDPYFIEEPVVNYSDHRDEPPKTKSNLIVKPKMPRASRASRFSHELISTRNGEYQVVRKAPSAMQKLIYSGFDKLGKKILPKLIRPSTGKFAPIKNIAKAVGIWGYKKFTSYTKEKIDQFFGGPLEGTDGLSIEDINRDGGNIKRIQVGPRQRTLKKYAVGPYAELAEDRMTTKDFMGASRVEEIDDDGSALVVVKKGTGQITGTINPNNKIISTFGNNPRSLVPSSHNPAKTMMTIFQHSAPVLRKLFSGYLGPLAQTQFKNLSNFAKMKVITWAADAASKGKNKYQDICKALIAKMGGKKGVDTTEAATNKGGNLITYKEDDSNVKTLTEVKSKGGNFAVKTEVKTEPGRSVIKAEPKDMKKLISNSTMNTTSVIVPEAQNDMSDWGVIIKQEKVQDKIATKPQEIKKLTDAIIQEQIKNFELLEPKNQIAAMKELARPDPEIQQVLNYNIYRAPKTFLSTSATAYYGGRSLASLPQNLLESYNSLVYKAKMDGTLPVDPTEKTSVAVYKDTGLDGPEPQVSANNDVDMVANEPDMVQVVSSASPAAAAPVEQGLALAPTEPDLVPVARSTKVLRCLRCNTFVSASKQHTMSECDARIKKFGTNRGKRAATSGNKKTRVDRCLLKVYRAQEKNYANISKKAKTLSKKYAKKGKLPKDIKSFLDKIKVSKK